MEKKEWFTHEVNSLIRSMENVIDASSKYKVFYVYCIVDKLVQLNEDRKEAKNLITKNLIEEEMKKLSYELSHYKVCDERFED